MLRGSNKESVGCALMLVVRKRWRTGGLDIGGTGGRIEAEDCEAGTRKFLKAG